MPKRRALRFALEVVFLVAVATALTVAQLRAPVVALVMLLGWVVAALFEWAAWLDTPHFGRGLPPRYYVPDVALPPSHPVEQEGAGYPAAADVAEEDLTWIVPAAGWGEVLEDWPVLDSLSVGEETQIAEPDLVEQEPREIEATSELDLSELPEAPVEELEAEPAAAALVDEPPEAAPADAVEEHVLAAEPVVPEPPPVEADLVPEPGPEAEPEPEPEPAFFPPEVAAPTMTSTHRIDPLAAPAGGRFRLRGRPEAMVVEVPAQPPAVRALPGRARRED